MVWFLVYISQDNLLMLIFLKVRKAFVFGLRAHSLIDFNRLKTNGNFSHRKFTNWVDDNQTLFSQINKNKIHSNLQNNIGYLGA